MFIFAIFILSIGSLPVAVVLLKTQSIGLVIADIPLFYMIYNLSYAIFSFACGKVERQNRRAEVLSRFGYIFLLVSYFVIARVTSSWALAGGFPSSSAFSRGSLTAFSGRLRHSFSGEEFRGGALGLLNAAYGFGALIAGIVGGILWQAYGSGVAFVGASCIVVVGLVLFIFSVKGPRRGGVEVRLMSLAGSRASLAIQSAHGEEYFYDRSRERGKKHGRGTACPEDRLPFRGY